MLCSSLQRLLPLLLVLLLALAPARAVVTDTAAPSPGSVLGALPATPPCPSGLYPTFCYLLLQRACWRRNTAFQPSRPPSSSACSTMLQWLRSR